ncbi:hypothetical protein ACWT_6287 [Actinoplanes sp. SE50]|uniref:hypothetical protein n=1 Tax=unclassified Actinoplanes TaxID=2626549 RepID=UPI00023ED302|nr:MULTISPECIES: hypothetical protein [unclassified Actinoplanes]AEV87302.1 hypothetical protein ACPL_6420 [Actinoplanes sp. SE50/110]ATO85702.1 hypothetical protein ACWT_6287 [Actinoplanes sp. SE50]SLM03115.1 hypothetical protein ACSP50_6404 [Actinoplanes sp. SE50/110]
MSRSGFDEQYGRDLLSQLPPMPDLPPHVDLSAAVTAGRRRRRARRIRTTVTAATLTAALVVAAPLAVRMQRRSEPPADPAPAATAAAPVACTAAWLPMPDAGTGARVLTAGDATGRWYAGSYRAQQGNGDTVILLWHDGRLVRTGRFPGVGQKINGINAAGTAVGQTIDDRRYRPYAYVGAQAVRLPGVTEGTAVAVNDAGVVVGSRMAGDHPVPVRWRSVSEAAVDLPLPAGYGTGEAIGIDKDGTVVGSIGPHGGVPEQPYLWHPDGTGELLPLPIVQGRPARVFDPSGIRDGWVAGVVVAAGDKTLRPYRYNVVDRTFESVAGRDVAISAINGSGWAVGYHTGAPGGSVLFAGPRETRLPAVPGAGEPDTRAVVISDDGRTVAGDGRNAAHRTQPVLWHCDVETMAGTAGHR